MKTKVYEENKRFAFTPENKIEEWKQLVYKKAKEGNIIKMYADTESTGFYWGNKGRPAYDPQTDRKILSKDSMVHNIPLHELEKEAKDLEGKIDRLIEFAFVVCYTNKNGETFLLKDSDGNDVYFHEMIHPNKDNLVPDNKKITKMPLVPYSIHKTSFDFLDGKEEHPFLQVMLNKPAISTEGFFEEFIQWFRDYEDDEIFDNIYMFFHNGDDFDIPFIDAELSRVTDGFLTLRDLVQTYDTLKIVKNIVPSDVQKFIAKCQNDEFFGGDSKIKDIKEENIQPTQKNLDNVVRLAKFLINFDPKKPEELHASWQSNYAKKIKIKLDEMGEKYWENLEDYLNKPDINIDFSTGPKVNAAIKKDENLKKLIEGYKKFRKSRNEYEKILNAMNKHEKVVKNLFNLKETIKENSYLKEALERLNNIDRSAHGARVDSQLFMDALIVIEGAFYPSPKISLTPDRKVSEIKEVKISEDLLSFDKKKLEPSSTNEDYLIKTTKKIIERDNKSSELKNTKRMNNRV